MSVTALTVIEDALIEIGVLPETQHAAPEDTARALRIINRDIMEPWSMQRQFASGHVFTTGTFAASGTSRTIGPTGTGSFVLARRPMALIGAARIDTNNLVFPISIRDHKWYNAQPAPLLSSPYITDIYYEPDSPDGTMRPYPIPSGINTVRIETLTLLAAFPDLTTLMDLLPGYESAITNTSKLLFCHAWNKSVPEGLEKLVRASQAAIQIVNAANNPRRVKNDAPGTITGPIGSDSVGFKTRDF